MFNLLRLFRRGSMPENVPSKCPGCGDTRHIEPIQGQRERFFCAVCSLDFRAWRAGDSWRFDRRPLRVIARQKSA